MIITTETAIVYKVGHRRFFTKNAAINALAWDMIKAKHPCDCEPADFETGYGGYPCWLHDNTINPLDAKSTHKRLVRMIKYIAKQQRRTR